RRPPPPPPLFPYTTLFRSQRGETALAARTYIDLAKRTRDPRVARRAVEVASQGKQNDLAVEAAKVWNDIEPGSAQTLQVLAALLDRKSTRLNSSHLGISYA